MICPVEPVPIRLEMDELITQAKSLGLTQADFNTLLNGHGAKSDYYWVTGPNSEEAARDRFEQGRPMEYQCYTDRWEPQGRAVVRLDHWEAEGKSFLVAEHQASSDGYYQHYAETTLQPGQAVYHLCSGAAKHCRARLPRGDGREVVHVDSWRMLSPRIMMESGDSQYMNAIGTQWMADLLAAWSPSDRGGDPVPGKGESGLDSALKEMMEEAKGAASGSKAAQKEVARKREDRGRSPQRKDMSSFLDQQARKRAAERRREDEARKERRKSGSERARKHKKKRRRDSEASDVVDVPSQSGSETSSGFPKAPARGGQDLLRLAKKKPGRLLQEALMEMAKFLAEREDGADGAEIWQGRKVMSYVSQVLLVTHPPQKIGIRNHREVVSVAMALDFLLAGKTAEAGPASEGARDLLRKGRVEHRPAPGAHPRHGRLHDQSGGARRGGQSGASESEASAGTGEGQIGARQRTGQLGKAVREPREGKPSPEPPQERKPKRRKGPVCPPEEGELRRRDRDPRREGREAKRLGGKAARKDAEPACRPERRSTPAAAKAAGDGTDADSGARRGAGWWRNWKAQKERDRWRSKNGGGKSKGGGAKGRSPTPHPEGSGGREVSLVPA